MQMIAEAGGLDAYLVSKSLRFDDGDGAYLNRTPSSAGSTTTFTWSGWVKLNNLAPVTHYLFTGVNSPYVDILAVRAGVPAGGSFSYYEAYTGWTVTSAALLRDPSAWYHLVCAVDTTQNTDSDRVKLYINGVVVNSFTTTPPYPAENQVLGINASGTDVQIGRYFTTVTSDFQLAEVHYIDGEQLTASDFAETNATTGQWIPKDCSAGLTYGTNGFYLKFNGTDLGEDSSGNGNHLTANNLVNTGPGTVNYIGNITGSISNAIDAFSASHINNYINTSTFAVTNTAWIGAWQGTAATENVFTPPGGLPVTSSLIVYYGCYANQARTSTLLITYTDTTTETDTFTSGSQNWMKAFTASNASGKTIQTISITNSVTNNSNYQSFGGFVIDGAILESYNPATDVSPDTPTPFDDEGNGTGNYATLNSLHKGTNATLSNGNLQLVNTTTWGTTIPTIGMSSGKWYAEVTLSGTITYPAFGVSSIDGAYVTSYMGQDADSYAWFAYSGGGLYTAAGYTNQTGDWVVDCVAGDVIGLALDMENGTLKYYKNGTLLDGGNAFTGITGTQFFATCGYSQTENWNFGQRAFAYTNAGVDRPAADYLALNTYNLDATEILSGTYEGNGDADGPVVWMNATPATLKIDTSDPPTTLVTFDPADVDPLAGGFKIRNSSTNNGSGTTYYWLATTNRAFKYANAQSNE